jgi:hypothetical protein
VHLLVLLEVVAALVELFPGLLGGAHELLVLLHLDVRLDILLGVGQREDELIVAQVLLLEVVSLLGLLSLDLLLLLDSESGLALHGSLLELNGLLLLVLLLVLEGQVEQSDCVDHQVLLDLEVKGRVSAEGGRVVHFKDPWLQVWVQYDIEAKQLKAHGVLWVIRLARLVNVSEGRLHGADGFNDGFFYWIAHFIGIMANWLKVFIDVSETALMSYAVTLFVLIKYELVAVFINGVVGQMHEQILKVIIAWWLVGLSRKPRETFVVHVDTEGVSTAEKDVYSEVEFKALNEEGFMEVSLNDIMVIGIDIIQWSCQEYSSALAWCFWLDNKRLILLLFIHELSSVIRVFSGKEVSLGIELIVIWK